MIVFWYRLIVEMEEQQTVEVPFLSGKAKSEIVDKETERLDFSWGMHLRVIICPYFKLEKFSWALVFHGTLRAFHLLSEYIPYFSYFLANFLIWYCLVGEFYSISSCDYRILQCLREIKKKNKRVLDFCTRLLILFLNCWLCGLIPVWDCWICDGPKL